MFERFTERARQVVVLAQEEARTLKHNYIGTEHILLGLLRVEDGLAARVLESLEIAVEDVRAHVVRVVGPPVEEITSGQIPFAPRAKGALQEGLSEALSLGHNYVGTEHLLLGLGHDESSTAMQVLRHLGVDAKRLRTQTLRLLEVGPRPVGSTRANRGADRAGEPNLGVAANVGLNPRARRIWQSAAEQAAEAGRAEVVPGDLLEPLLSDETIASVLAGLGVDVPTVRERLQYIGWSEPEAPDEG